MVGALQVALDFIGQLPVRIVENLSSEKSKQDAGAATQANKHSTIECHASKKMKAVSSSVGSVRQGEFDWIEFLKTYFDLTESEARVCCDMLKVMNESDLEGMNSNVVRRLGIADTTLRAKVVSGIRFYVRNKSQT